MLAFLSGIVLAAASPEVVSYWSLTFPSLLLVIAGPGELFPFAHTVEPFE